MPRARSLSWAFGALGLVVAARVPAAETTPLSPEETVRRYLQALKDGRFDAAYDLVSKAMKQGKDREVWVKEQKTGMAFADVKIFEFHVHPGKVEGATAWVPNVLSSQDRFVNQLGLTEYELYTLLKEDGAWKVDRQVIVEPKDVSKWFPKADAGGGSSH
ncbi:MAG: hypothetical protein E6J59_09090 [Deltaproteobacteria bacterium]|nr:MAG: hypothetical protein E6J59_09090 [Deltaproteobacteria bacterium]